MVNKWLSLFAASQRWRAVDAVDAWRSLIARRRRTKAPETIIDLCEWVRVDVFSLGRPSHEQGTQWNKKSKKPT